MINDQGVNSVDAFHGRSNSTAIQAFYKDSAPLYSGFIRKNLKSGKYSMADFGE